MSKVLRRWRSRYQNALTLCAHAGLLLAGIVAAGAGRNEIWGGCALISLGLSVYAWQFNLSRLHAITEQPTSTIAAAAQGYVELAGKARNILPLKSPLQGIPCVWFRYWIYAKDSNNLWQLQHYRSSEQNFEIKDASGRCRVNPAGAEVIAAKRKVVRQHRHKYIEELLCSDKPLYVLGALETITEVTAERQHRQEVGSLLTQWKKSSDSFKNRFDLDRNDEIDMHEWELARAQASHEVKLRRSMRPEMHLIQAPADNRLFLISGIAPQELRARYRFWALLHMLIAGGTALLALIITYGHSQQGLW